MARFIAYDLLEQDYETFDKEEDAGKWCKEAIAMYLNEDASLNIADLVGYAEIRKKATSYHDLVSEGIF